MIEKVEKSGSLTFKQVQYEDIDEWIPGALNGTPGVAAYNEKGELVAYLGIITSVTLDPVWIREDKRKSPFILRRLWAQARKWLKEAGAIACSGVILDKDQENAELVERICKRLAGAKPVDVRLLHIDLSE
jgi:hypothetical protein